MVRPVFRRWLRILLPPLVAVFGVVLWGDTEVRRFERAVAEVDRRAPRPTLASGEDGTRFYAAAAILADAPRAYPAAQTAIAVRDAVAMGGQPNADLAAAATETLRMNEATFAAVDRAAELQLKDVRGRFTVLRSVPVWSTVPAVVSIRTLDRVARRDCDGGARSLLSSLRFLRGASADPQSFSATQQANALRGVIADLAVLLQKCPPSIDALHRLDAALAEHFRADDLQNLIKGQSEFRYRNISFFLNGTWFGSVLRPLRYSVAADVARSAAEALDVAAKPWPERVRGMAALPRRVAWLAPPPFRDLGGLMPAMLQRLAETYANGVAAVHVGQTAIALEAYRRAESQYPSSLAPLRLSDDRTLDPFTGVAIVYRPRADGYMLYSVGANGRDDGGNVGPATKAIVPGAIGLDVGIVMAAPISSPPLR